MGKSYRVIPFFVDTIKLDVHTASSASLLGRHSIRQLTRDPRGGPSRRCSLEQCDETGEYLLQMAGGDFAEGPEV